MIIQPFIENALWHGLMHKKSDGNLLVELKNENEYVCCIVEDDGVGRKKSKEYKSINNAKKKSLGMSVTKERLEILNQDKNKTAGIDIVDKEDDKEIATGTKVIINIPIDTRF
jgi:sensor histidine kinase YesM